MESKKNFVYAKKICFPENMEIPSLLVYNNEMQRWNLNPLLRVRLLSLGEVEG